MTYGEYPTYDLDPFIVRFASSISSRLGEFPVVLAHETSRWI